MHNKKHLLKFADVLWGKFFLFYIQLFCSLNGKSYLLQGGAAIPENADMNDYVTPGNYYCTTDSNARTLKNCPFTHAFTLKVEYCKGYGIPSQTFREYNTGITAYRKYESSIWIDFVYFSNDAAIFAGTIIKSGDDLNDYKTPGIYRSQSSNISMTLINAPEVIQSGFSLIVFYMAESTNVQIIFSGDRMYMRLSNTGGWQSWYKFTGTAIK